MQKIIIPTFLVSLLLTTSCYADNFYAGLGFGHESANFDKKLTISSPTNDYSYYKTDNLAGSGFNGNVFAGYEWNIKRFSLATELNISISNLKYNGFYNEMITNNYNDSEAEFTLDKSYGISLLPGYQIFNNVSLYGRLGYSRSHFKYAEYKTNTNVKSGVTEYDWLNGLRYGIGINTTLTPNFGMRLEIDQTRYNTFTNTTFPMPAGRFRKISLTPTVNQVELDLVYHFA